MRQTLAGTSGRISIFPNFKVISFFAHIEDTDRMKARCLTKYLLMVETGRFTCRC